MTDSFAAILCGVGHSYVTRQSDRRSMDGKATSNKAARAADAGAPENAFGRRGESPLQVNVTSSRLQLRRRKTRWGAAGGERPVRRLTNSIWLARCGESAIERRSPEFPLGGVPWGSNLGPTRRQVTCLDEAERPQVVGDGMVGR